ncbi:hypothetical protein [Amycolatopsis sp. NPDC051061]|uniref:hypothetical protein n=1 Tax=Amycolatopsis sp. NPDC051061 TaxID=3155042 RepID=UPI0034440C91
MVTNERPADAADALSDQLPGIYDRYAADVGGRRLTSITERRGPEHAFAFGYLRTTPETPPSRHHAYAEELEYAECDVVRTERAFGDDLTPGFHDLLRHIRPGDTLLVPRRAHLSSSPAASAEAVALVEARGGRVKFLHHNEPGSSV